MIFYEFLVEYKEDKQHKVLGSDLENYEKNLGVRMNKNLKTLRLSEESISAYVYVIEKEQLEMALFAKAETAVKTVWKAVSEKLNYSMNISCKLKNSSEITAERFRNLIAEGDSNNLVRSECRIMRELKLDYDANPTFNVSEEIYSPTKQTLKSALQKAKELMVGSDYMDEIRRIYSKENMKRFLGHPVHYHLIAGNRESADAMLEVLIASLHNNNRLISGRINYVTDMTDNCYNEKDFENLIKNSQGSTVILPLNYVEENDNNYASTYNEVIHFVGKLIKKYHRKVLFIFLELTSKKSYAKSMINELCEDIRILELSEGAGNRKQAQAMLKKLICTSEYECLRDEGDEEVIPQQDSYKLAEIYTYYEEWINRKIYQKAYKTYATKTSVKIEEEKPQNSAYERLQNMVGLSDIKKLVEQMVAMQKIKKLRLDIGVKQQSNAMHMIFTGNPGSAKTTVARLLTSILKEEGIIKNGKLVECGRSELVGKYVGWTAVQVKKKFKEARGGVLFIDEAYSLVDEHSGSFGDEAINTIVQEMENHRTDVIVIFAGYPEKMKRFLDKNEGLRSRIAFHVNFPDYNKEEMTEILKVMVKENGFTCHSEALKKCEQIFGQAVEQEEFGNGRYVRNLLEQAIMKQSRRLMLDMAGKEIDKAMMQQLLPEDFEIPMGHVEKRKSTVGFSV